MKLVIALVISVIAMQADAADTLGLEKGLFGLSWGESAAVIRSRFPQAVVAAAGEHIALLAVKGDFSFAGHAVDAVVMRFDSSNRLNFMNFHVWPTEQNVLLRQLKSAWGEPRHMSAKEGRIYSQIVEWSRPQVSVSLWAVTTGPQLTDSAAEPVSVRVQPGPLDSEIDRAEKQKKELKERFRSENHRP